MEVKMSFVDGRLFIRGHSAIPYKYEEGLKIGLELSNAFKD